MKKDVFENNWSDRFANVRNMIAGTANAKESFPERWTDIDHKLKCKLTKREYLEEIKLIKLFYGFRNKIQMLL